ncbi:unnamed protein product [Effrenium voratum]|uniref:Uncharacterized protein n=1 Tax=Effrenium voratum TaxID=2562239 RepID=A0AA36JDM8_9DINO|nr:unnamed protein product [Effrenium voratum]CAJ1437957.1 unnamed protein product [Effrenium voratum]
MRLLFVSCLCLATGKRFSTGRSQEDLDVDRADSDLVTCTAAEVLNVEGAPEDFQNPLVDLDSSHRLFALLGTGVDSSALQTCYNLHRKQTSWKLTWKQKVMDKLVSLSTTAMGTRVRTSVLQPLMKNILDWGQDAGERLITWAFEHDIPSPFCRAKGEIRREGDRDVWKHFGHLLLSGSSGDKVPDPGSQMVNQSLSQLITKAIGATLQADCGNLEDQTVDSMTLSWNESVTWPPVVQRSFELLASQKLTPREKGYAQALLNTFQKYVIENNVDLTNPMIPQEVQPLWDLLVVDSSNKSSRVFAAPQEVLQQPTNATQRPKSCSCRHIELATAAALSDRMAKLGFDASRAENNWVWEATDLGKMMNLFTLTEEGLEDPNLSFLYLLQEANHLTATPVDQNGGIVGDEARARSVVKGILVGMPMLQNYLAHLDIKNGGPERIKTAYALKEKWFLFLNIAWAVWHENDDVGQQIFWRVSKEARQQNVALGLLVSAFSVLSEFSWDGVNFKEENSPAFNDFNVALYTIWNYKFVHSLFEPRRLQFHFWHGLGLPLLEAFGNQGDSAYWVNYRRDGLMAAMMNLAPQPQDAEE